MLLTKNWAEKIIELELECLMLGWNCSLLNMEAYENPYFHLTDEENVGKNVSGFMASQHFRVWTKIEIMSMR